MYSLALIIFVVSEQKAFEYFPIGSNVNLCPAVAAIWISDRHKKHKICRGPSNDHSWAVWFQLSKWFQRRRHFNIFPQGPMLIYFLRWRPSWISDRHNKQKFCKGPSNNHSWAVWFQLSKQFQRRSVLNHFPNRIQCQTKSCRSRHFEFHIGQKT